MSDTHYPNMDIPDHLKGMVLYEFTVVSWVYPNEGEDMLDAMVGLTDPLCSAEDYSKCRATVASLRPILEKELME